MITDLAFVVGLGDTERHSLGFIPEPTIQRRCIEPGNYVLIYDQHGHRRGYILHGPLKAGRAVHIYQTCVETDFRMRTFAAHAVEQLRQRALVVGCTSIDLRCALDLSANAFWLAIGFTLLRYEMGGSQRQRAIAHYSMQVTPFDLLHLPKHFF